jgi:hypothetical protein
MRAFLLFKRNLRLYKLVGNTGKNTSILCKKSYACHLLFWIDHERGNPAKIKGESDKNDKEALFWHKKEHFILQVISYLIFSVSFFVIVLQRELNIVNINLMVYGYSTKQKNYVELKFSMYHITAASPGHVGQFCPPKQSDTSLVSIWE